MKNYYPMITNLSEHKYNFVISELLKQIPTIENYKVDKYETLGDIYKFKTKTHEYRLTIKNGSIRSITVFSRTYIDDQCIEYKMTGYEDKDINNNLIKEFFNRIIDIEDHEFKSIYPNYDSSEDRDAKLTALLGKDLFKEVKKEVKKEKDILDIKKKKWYQWF